MQFKPTPGALLAARERGTVDALNRAAGLRSTLASNRSEHGKRAAKHLTASTRRLCGIPAYIALFEPA